MHQHPLNLALRFLLELAGLAAIGVSIYRLAPNPYRWFLAVLIFIMVAAAWGIFRVEGDPGKAPIAISGKWRLFLEFCVFGLAIALLYKAQYRWQCYVFAGLCCVHYVISWQRVWWLITGGR